MAWCLGFGYSLTPLDREGIDDFWRWTIVIYVASRVCEHMIRPYIPERAIAV
jgi:hypothetical protein